MDLQKYAIAWTGTVYRFSEVAYASKEDLTTGLGAKQSGGRWNPKGTFATLYTSLTPETALAEVKAHFDYYQLNFADATPTVLTSLDIVLRRALDLTDGRLRAALRVSLKRMKAEDWRKLNRGHQISLTQALGLKVMEAGFEAIVVPSFIDLKSRNLVIFPDNLRSGSTVRIANERKLPSRVDR